MKIRAALGDTAKALLSLLVFFAVIEVAVRGAYAIRNSRVEYVVLPYKAAQDFGPIPPWMDDFRILESDEILGWKTRPLVHRRYMDVFSPVHVEEDRTRLLRSFIPRIPASLGDNSIWEVSTNSAGFRDGEFPNQKPPSSFRIVCLGDSWTFGANVDQEASYPQRLRALIQREFPDADFEVLNLGVLGYSSYQGLQVLKKQALDLDPDLLLIGFAMNDANVAGWRDKDWFESPKTEAAEPISKSVGKLFEKVESYRLLKYLTLIIKYRSWSIGEYMQKLAASSGTPDEPWFGGIGNESADYDELEQYTRVSPRDYEDNLGNMIRLAKSRDVGVILLFNELWDTAYRAAVRRVAEHERLPLIDSKILVDEGRAAIEEELEKRLALTPRPAGASAATGDEVEVIFRVHSGDQPVPAAIFIAGTHPELGETIPNQVALYDDGTHGDQRAGDKVWSLAATLPADTTFFYVYTNGEEAGKWEGLDIPEIRRLTVAAPENGGPLYRPIETFGEMYMQADGWHTNAAGYELMADAVLEELKKNEKVREHIGQVPAGP